MPFWAMEATGVLSENEPTSDRTAAVVPSEEEYTALDVFGTEAFDSVCGVDILDPFYRLDVKRVVSMWSMLLLVGTTVLTLGFFGCFRRLKGENLDLSRNLWSEDLFWTSLIHFMLTCLAVTCGLSALASHTNLHSHAKVLGFRRVFRWCLTLHAAVAVFTLVVALKLTVVDLLEPQSGVILTTKKNAPRGFAGNGDLKRPQDVYVYPRDPPLAKPLTPSSLSPKALSFLQVTTVCTNVPRSAGNAETTETASSSVVATGAPNLSLTNVRLIQHTTPLVDFLQQMAGRSREATRLLHGAPVNSPLLRKVFTRKEASQRVPKWTANEELPHVALHRSGSSQKTKVSTYPTSIVQSEGGLENYSGSFTRALASPFAYAEPSASLRGSESGAKGAPEKAPLLIPVYEEGEQSFVSRASGSHFLPVLLQHGSRQSSTAVQLRNHRRGAPVSESKTQPAAQFKSLPKCVFIDMRSAESISAASQRKRGKNGALVEQTTMLPTAGLSKSVFGKTDTQGSTRGQRRQQVHVSFFLMDGSEELQESADRSAASEVKSELRPIRDSRVYRSMLYFVVALDYSATVLHIVCFMYTWHLASKIGGMFGLKILKMPF